LTNLVAGPVGGVLGEIFNTLLDAIFLAFPFIVYT
jgi:hypothetical protein